MKNKRNLMIQDPARRVTIVMQRQGSGDDGWLYAFRAVSNRSTKQHQSLVLLLQLTRAIFGTVVKKNNTLLSAPVSLLAFECLQLEAV